MRRSVKRCALTKRAARLRYVRQWVGAVLAPTRCLPGFPSRLRISSIDAQRTVRLLLPDDSDGACPAYVLTEAQLERLICRGILAPEPAKYDRASVPALCKHLEQFTRYTRRYVR